MGSVNKCILVGNICQDIELKYTPSGTALASIVLATNETYKDKSGERQQKTEYHRITAWGKTAENCSKHLGKGRLAYFEGRLETRSYEKNGQKHYATNIVVDRVTFLNGGKSQEAQSEREAGSDDGDDSEFPL